MELNELRDRAYRIACANGFHEEEKSDEHWLCLYISELMEAVEADRKGRYLNRRYYEVDRISGTSFRDAFEKHIKGSVDEELADALIRLLDFCGLRGIDLSSYDKVIHTPEFARESKDNFEGTFTENMYAFSTYFHKYGDNVSNDIDCVFLALIGYTIYLGVDILWVIKHKMEYNELREYRHGKMY